MSIQVQVASGKGDAARRYAPGAWPSFVREHLDLPSLIAVAGILLLLAGCLGVILFPERAPVRAYPPASLTAAQIRTAETIGETFNPTPPDQRPQKGR
ncbi:hypothetical protein [Caulobacter mirabilis]|uniref:hypothetical protein n=1 Tax=Caulobacter mirabilis TaxID=69666 RepID=UPI001237159B|nr:hypothetical protein [Caulobacter mirabilis]